MSTLNWVLGAVTVIAASGTTNAQDARDPRSATPAGGLAAPATPETAVPPSLRLAAIDVSAAAFRKLDTDHDGRISALEANAAPRVAEGFLQADANKDGFLSLEEFRSLAEITPTPSP